MPETTYPVVTADILALPSGRRRDVLALKAAALVRGEAVTRALHPYGVRCGDDALRLLIGWGGDEAATLRIGSTEPADPSDAGPEPVSLRDFAADRARRRSRLADEALQRSRDESECGRHRQAAVEIAMFLDVEPHAPREALMAEMLALSAHEPYAAACYGEARMRGDGVPRDVEDGLRHLLAAEMSDDAEAAAWASVWLGDYYEVRPGEARRALRHYEAAARYGHETGAFNAGLIHQHGRPGVRIDLAKAAEFYRMGAGMGGRDSRTNLAVLLARRHVEPLPGEDWRAMLQVSSEAGDHIAAGFLDVVREVEEDPRGLDLPARLREIEADNAAPPFDVLDEVLGSLAEPSASVR